MATSNRSLVGVAVGFTMLLLLVGAWLLINEGSTELPTAEPAPTGWPESAPPDRSGAENRTTVGGSDAPHGGAHSALAATLTVAATSERAPVANAVVVVQGVSGPQIT